MINFTKILNLISVCVFSVCFSYCSASSSNPMTSVSPAMQNNLKDRRCVPICLCDRQSHECGISAPVTRQRSLSSPESPSSLYFQNDLTATSAYNAINQASHQSQDGSARHIKMPVLPTLVRNAKDSLAANQKHRKTCSSSSAAYADTIPADDYQQDSAAATCDVGNCYAKHTIGVNNTSAGILSPVITFNSNNDLSVCKQQAMRHTRVPSRSSSPSPSMMTMSVANYQMLHALATCNSTAPSQSSSPGVVKDLHDEDSDVDMHGYKEDTRRSAADSSSASSISDIIDITSLFRNRDVYTILCCDGGGMRGAMEIKLCEEIQRAVGARLGANIQLAFNGYAGTSTGALTVTSVALGKNHNLYEHYPEYGSRIFTRNWWSCWGLLGPKYYSYGRMACIQDFVNDMFGRELGADLIVPYYSALTRTTKVYTNYNSEDDLRLADVLMMSSAAPTYFNPHYCQSEHNIRYVGLDGGIFSNHPGLIAYHETRQRHPDANIIMLSLGTGECCNYGNPDRYRNRGLLSWASEFPSLAIESSSWNIHEQLINLSKNDINFEYIRLQPRLEAEDLVTDNTDPKYIQKLISACDTYIARHPPEYKRAIEVCEQYCAKEV